MSDFLLSLLKGLYPQFFLFAALGIFLRIRRREWTRFDSLLLGMYLFFFLSLAFQPWLFYRLLVTSRRYLLVALPLCLPFTALGVRDAWRFLCRTPRRKIAGILLLAVCTVFTVWDVYSPLIKEYTSRKKSHERQTVVAAARMIRADWRNRASARVTVMRCDEYQSGKHPLVETHFGQVGYLSGGQLCHPFLKEASLLPDYRVTVGRINEPGWTEVAEGRAAARLPDDIFIYRREAK